jgi:hypothetical protein
MMVTLDPRVKCDVCPAEVAALAVVHSAVSIARTGTATHSELLDARQIDHEFSNLAHHRGADIDRCGLDNSINADCREQMSLGNSTIAKVHFGEP